MRVRSPVVSTRCAGSRTTIQDRPSEQKSSCCAAGPDRKSTRLNSSHGYTSYAAFCLKKTTRGSPRAHPLSGLTSAGKDSAAAPQFKPGTNPTMVLVELNALISRSDEQGSRDRVADNDLVDVKGMVTTAGGIILPNVPAARDAPAIRRVRPAG